LQYGWVGSSLEGLDADAQDVFQEAYSSDPSWAAQGAPLLKAPQLAGGRIVIELSSQVCTVMPRLACQYSATAVASTYGC
jgi:hypothetical protein